MFAEVVGRTDEFGRGRDNRKNTFSPLNYEHLKFPPLTHSCQQQWKVEVSVVVLELRLVRQSFLVTWRWMETEIFNGVIFILWGSHKDFLKWFILSGANCLRISYINFLWTVAVSWLIPADERWLEIFNEVIFILRCSQKDFLTWFILPGANCQRIYIQYLYDIAVS
jgi:hypothetical protein